MLRRPADYFFHKLLCGAGIAALALLSTACSEPNLDTTYANYLERLGNTLSVEPHRLSRTLTPRHPRSGKLQIAIEGTSVDTLDFLALSGCAVQITIGKRNSSLGRMARPSQRLLLELEYLRLAPACITQLRARDEQSLADTLQQAWEAKHQQLPALIFNATLAGEEFRALWKVNPEPGTYPPVSSSAVIAALGSLNHHVGRWLKGDYRAANREFEILLGEIAGGDAGVLLQSLARQKEWLDEANRMLAERMQKGPLCATDIRHAAADVLPQVVRKYFIEAIQPDAAQMQRRVYNLLPPLAALENTLELEGALPTIYGNWKNDRETLLHQAVTAPARHVGKLQEIQKGCEPL